ncbi:peptide-methionine (S)-S-oxide reductase MsrA [Longivirga aurantiaca]|uniref:Peptide methionine sulfoxide reductase MsrA n=1 Tax=Longivirga aurantiaca TaxID=1837743 RepID=A0ABW1SZN6_9ACTN
MFSSLFDSSAKTRMVTPTDALPGRATRPFAVPATHAVLGTPLEGPFPDGLQSLYVGLGCFWGAEKRFWRVPGVYTTAVGYQGGITPNPSYEEVCTARTGHAENVLVVYDPEQVSTYDLLKVFWENHDPTQGYRQGNDVGTQYRSALYWTTPEQAEIAQATKDAYEKVLVAKGFDPITTELGPAEGLPFYYAEDYHQQYLYKVPHGYDCHAETGLALPPL